LKKSAEKVGQLLNYEKFSGIHLVNLPKVEKEDITNYIKCPNYEKAMGKLNSKMERYNSKVSRLKSDIADMKRSISNYDDRLSSVQKDMKSMKRYQGAWDERDLNKYNGLVAQNNDIINQARKVSEKRDDTIDKLTEAQEEANETLEELTNEALSVIDEDIAMTITRIENIVSNLASSEDPNDLLAGIDICLIGLRIHAMFDDLLDDNSSRNECKEGVAKINKKFSTLCADKAIQKYMVDIYRRNLDLVQKNAAISQQINSVLAYVDQNQLSVHVKAIKAVLAGKFETKFDFSNVIDPAEINEIVNKMQKAIKSINHQIDKAKAFQAVGSPTIGLSKAGVNADQQAKSLKASMQTNFHALDEPLMQSHFAIQAIDEAVIDDFYQKDLRVAVTALRKHIIDTIGEASFEAIFKGGNDLFSLQKGKNAIDNANLTRLQSTLDKIPYYIKELTEQIASAEADIKKVNAIPKEKADALITELGSKYVLTCVPIIGFFGAIGIHGRVKTFEIAFRSSNRIYKDLGNMLLEKNNKMIIVALMINLILGLGSLIFFVMKGGPVYISIIVLATYFITFLMQFMTGTKLKSYLDVSTNGKA